MGGGNQDQFIHFADPVVKQILVELWGGADGGSAALNTRVNNTKVPGVGGEMTYKQAASVYNMRDTFINNTDIRSFDELQYFTGLSMCPVFRGCTLDTVTIPSNVIAFYDSTISTTKIENMHILGSTVNSVGFNTFRTYYITNVYLDTLEWFFSYNIRNVEQTPLWLATNLYVNEVLTTHIDIPEGITTLYSWFCSKAIHSMTLPNSLTTIGSSAFRNTQMQTLTIPSGVTSLGNVILYNTTLPEMVFLPTTPPTSTASTWTNNKVTTIYVPDGSVDAYKAADNWSGVASKIKGLSELPS